MLLALLVAPALMAPVDLQLRVEAFAGRPAIVDARLLLPECPAPQMTWAGSQSVAVRCAMPAWQVFIPLAARAEVPPVPVAPTIRRGDRVVVESAGAGFVVGMEAVAESDSRDSRVSLRVGSNRRLTGTIGSDGHVRINGLNATVSDR